MTSSLKSGSGKGTHVGYRTQVNKAGAYTDIAFSATDNRVHCPYCNGVFFQVKGGDSVDDVELDPKVDGKASGALNMVVFLCHCGREFAKNLAVTGEWTEQV